MVSHQRRIQGFMVKIKCVLGVFLAAALVPVKAKWLCPQGDWVSNFIIIAHTKEASAKWINVKNYHLMLSACNDSVLIGIVLA